jgi:serine protease
VAAGNNNLGGPSVIGNSGYGNVDALVVGATGPRGEVAWYSSPLNGTKWAVLGPGGNSASCQSNPTDCVISTYWSPGQQDVYAFSQGTSMAAPMVSAVVALLLGMGQTPNQAINTILATATPGANCSCAGVVNAAAAVQSALNQGAHPAVASSVRAATTGPATQPAVIVAAKTTLHATSDQPHPTAPPTIAPRATVITPALPQTLRTTTTTTTTTVTTPPASTSIADRQPPSPALALSAPISSSTHRTGVASWAALAALLVAATALLTVMRRQQV